MPPGPIVNGSIPGQINDPQEPPKSHKGLIIAGIVAGVLVVVGILIFLIANADPGNKAKTKETTQQSTTDAPALEPAQSVEMEQANNALSQDLSRLDDEKDLPAKSLENDTLGL
jgi:hypothetical protein